MVADVTPVVTPYGAEPDILGMVLDVFWPIQATFVEGEPLCGVGFPYSALITYSGSFFENRVVGCRCNTCRAGVPDRAERGILEMVFDFLGQFRPLL